MTANPTAVNQSQTCSLTSTAVSTGTSPYNYLWLEKSPGGSYVDVGTNSAGFNFVTSGSTTPGIWSLELQVTDNAGVVVTSGPATVTVNDLPTVSVSPSTWVMDVGQSKTFSASASGGSGSYTAYQWYVNNVAQTGQTASTFGFCS